MSKGRELKRPVGWLTVKEVQEFVKDRFARHWSNAYMYELMGAGKLRYFRLGSIRILLEKDVNALVKTFRKPSDPAKKSTKT